MTLKIILPCFLICLFGQNNFAQGSNSEFYSEANGTIGDRIKVNAVGFRTKNSIVPFYEMVQKRFGVPKSDGQFFLYGGYNKKWTKSKILLRVSSSIEIGLDSSKSNTIFIFAETKNKIDLLKPGTSSYKKIKAYFLFLFNKIIKNGEPDNFNWMKEQT